MEFEEVEVVEVGVPTGDLDFLIDSKTTLFPLHTIDCSL